MPQTKTELFGKKDNRLAKLARALAHPARVAILKELSERNSCVCGEIVARVPLAQATVSQHLKELKEAGLVKGDIDGPRVCYCLDLEGVRQAHEELESFTKHLLEQATAHCC